MTRALFQDICLVIITLAVVITTFKGWNAI
jgi:hypothetical protein